MGRRRCLTRKTGSVDIDLVHGHRPRPPPALSGTWQCSREMPRPAPSSGMQAPWPCRTRTRRCGGKWRSCCCQGLSEIGKVTIGEVGADPLRRCMDARLPHHAMGQVVQRRHPMMSTVRMHVAMTMTMTMMTALLLPPTIPVDNVPIHKQPSKGNCKVASAAAGVNNRDPTSHVLALVAHRILTQK